MKNSIVPWMAKTQASVNQNQAWCLWLQHALIAVPPPTAKTAKAAPLTGWLGTMKKKKTKETAAIAAICRRILTTLLSIAFSLCLKEVYCPGVELSVGGYCKVWFSATEQIGNEKCRSHQ